MSIKTQCAVPWSTGFTDYQGGYRNCCMAHPQRISKPGDSFASWWNSTDMSEFRESVSSTLPSECAGCIRQEADTGSSFRTAVNDAVTVTQLHWPSRWNVSFGNTCNLACWSCDETASSRIEQQKKQIGLLPREYHSAKIDHGQLITDILHSYEFHETVTITILGGEPLYNKSVVDFLHHLIRLDLAQRTRLEFHTNATIYSDSVFDADWQHICVFASIDAVGELAEWVRYGCDWNTVNSVVQKFAQRADYTEVHCTLSVLNICGLADLASWCKEQNLSLQIATVDNPEMMNLSAWDGDPNLLCSRADLEEVGYQQYYDMIGTTARVGSCNNLQQYVQKFSKIRKNPPKILENILQFR